MEVTDDSGHDIGGRAHIRIFLDDQFFYSSRCSMYPYKDNKANKLISGDNSNFMQSLSCTCQMRTRVS